MHPLLDSDASLLPVMTSVQASLGDVERLFDAQLASDLPPVMQLVRHVERYRGKMLRPILVVLAGMASHPQVTATSSSSPTSSNSFISKGSMKGWKTGILA